MPKPIDLNLLPPQAREISEIIGHEKATALLSLLGGADITFGGKMRGRIAETIGSEALDKLIYHYGCASISLPRCDAAFRMASREKAIEALRNGATLNEAALIAGVTRRTITNWVLQERQKPASRL